MYLLRWFAIRSRIKSGMTVGACRIVPIVTGAYCHPKLDLGPDGDAPLDKPSAPHLPKTLLGSIDIYRGIMSFLKIFSE